MLFLILKWGYLSTISYLLGIGLVSFFNKLLKKEEKQINLLMSLLLGLTLCGTLISSFSLFYRVGALANVLIFAIALLSGWVHSWKIKSDYHKLKNSWRKYPVYVSVFILWSFVWVMYLSVQQSICLDEGQYYSQLIKWYEQYGAVPGLANLYPRYGLFSNWHILSAFFNFSWLTGQESNQLNGGLYLVILLYFFRGIFYSKSVIESTIYIGGVVFLHFFYICMYNLNTPNTDLPSFYISLLILIAFLQRSRRNQLFELDIESMCLIWLCLFLITLKLSMLFIAFIPFLIFVKTILEKSFHSTALIFFTGLFIITPMLAHNLILTGYLIFPLEASGFLQPDWAVPVEVAREIRNLVLQGGYQLYSVDKVLVPNDFPLLSKVKIWFIHNLRIYDKALVFMMILSPLIHFLLRRKTNKLYGRQYWIILLNIYMGFAFWLQNGPDPRFFFGFIVFTAIVTVVLLLPDYVLRQRQYLIVLGIIGAFFFQLITIHYRGYIEDKFIRIKWMDQSVPQTSLWLMPKPYPPSVLDNTMFLEMENKMTPVYERQKRCWDAPIPCTMSYNNKLQMRGNDLENGFRISED